MTRRMSPRAQAQEIYREMTSKHSLPTPEARSQRGGETVTAQARALYEGSAVPVAEIARLAGVTERTIYKYARKGGWTPRYCWTPPGADAARGRGWRADESFAAAKGAGGRFIARADKGKPFAVGIAATDPARAARAGKACAGAAAIGRAAEAEAAAAQKAEAQISAIDAAVRAIADYRRYCDPAGKAAALPLPLRNRVENAFLRVVDVTLARWKFLLDAS